MTPTHSQLSDEEVKRAKAYQDDYHYSYLDAKFFGKLASENLNWMPKLSRLP